MNKEKLEKLHITFTILCLIGFIALMILSETSWLDFLSNGIAIMLILTIIAISFVGIFMTFKKMELIDAYEKGQTDEKLSQLIKRKRSEKTNNLNKEDLYFLYLLVKHEYDTYNPVNATPDYNEKMSEVKNKLAVLVGED